MALGAAMNFFRTLGSTDPTLFQSTDPLVLDRDMTQEELEKQHYNPEWLAKRDPKKRSNRRQRAAKKKDNMKLDVVKQKQKTKQELASERHKLEKLVKETAIESHGNSIDKKRRISLPVNYTNRLSSTSSSNGQNYDIDKQGTPRKIDNSLASDNKIELDHFKPKQQQLKRKPSYSCMDHDKNENSEQYLVDTRDRNTFQENCELLYVRTTDDCLDDEEIPDAESNDKEQIDDFEPFYTSETESTDDWFEKEDSRLEFRKSSSSKTPTEDTTTRFEESLKYYEKLDGVKNYPINLDIGILQNGIDLSEDYLEQFSGGMSGKNDFYKAYGSYETISSLCSRQPEKYKRCVIEMKSAHLATCTPIDTNDPIKEIEISGRSKCGQAFSEDKVVVKILNTHVDQHRSNVPSQKYLFDNKTYGEVVGVVERTRFRNVPNPVFICVLDETEGHLMKPLCKTIPKIHIFNSKVLKKFPKLKKHKVEIYRYNKDKCRLDFKHYCNINPGDRRKYIFVVAFVSWRQGSIYPLGAVIDVLQSNNDLNTGLKIVELQNQVPFIYKKSTVDGIKSLLDTMTNDEIPPWILKDREDIPQTVRVFTIDPPRARDLDDALSLQRLSRNICRVGVHIADVTSIIEKGDAVDNEAAERATSFYPGQDAKAFHMLPEPLSQNLCSLLPGRKRIAISVFFKVNSKGAIIEKPEIKKTVIKSCRRLTYEEAQDIIMDRDIHRREINEDIKILFNIAITLRKIRLKDAIHALPVEVDPCLDPDDVLKSLEAHMLVEEFMVLTNHTIGQFTTHYFPECSLLRCQNSPSDETIKGWIQSHPYIADVLFHLQNKKVSDTRELSINSSPNARYRCIIALQRWVWKQIETFSSSEIKQFDKAWKLLATDEIHPEQALALERWYGLLESAKYICSGDLNNETGLHFSLNLYNYTHFTSPIRRYPDLIVHRLVHAILDKKRPKYSTHDVINLSNRINITTKQAKDFQKQCKILRFAESLNENPRIFNGFVQEITESGIVVFFPGLRDIPKLYREIPFALLDINTKPQIGKENNKLRLDENTERDYAVVTWQKRLYRHSGIQKTKKDDNLTVGILNPHPRTVFMLYRDYIALLKGLLSANKRSLQEKITNIKYDVNHDMCKDWLYPEESHVDDVTSEVQKGLITKHRCEFKLSFHINQVVAIQMAAEPRLGLLVPSPQIIDVTPDFKCCLSHISDPVKYLAHYATVPTKSVYSSLKEYMKTWLPILEMESAKKAVEDSVVINNMPVEFKGRQGKFTQRKSYFDARDIDFEVLPIDFLDSLEKETDVSDDLNNEQVKDQGFISVTSSDYLCIRYPEHSNIGTPTKELPPKCQRIWSGHANITKVRNITVKKEKQAISQDRPEFEKKKERKDEITITDVVFKLHSNAPNPTVGATKTTDNCCVEILFKTHVDRRTESFLKMIDNAGPLVKAVALGNEIPALDEIHRNLSRVMPSDVNIESLAVNNTQQNKAIRKALNSSFSLIQGPPGTGKSFTAMKLIYLFNELNTNLAKETGNKKHQIVFCGPSNKSVDLVTRWMKEKFDDMAPRIIRMYGNTYEKLDFPVPGRADAATKSTRNVRIDEKLMSEGLVLHWVIRQEGKPFADELKMFDAKFGSVHKKLNEKDEKIRKKMHVGNITLKDLHRYSKISSEAKQEELKNYDVIFCTTSVAANPSFLKSVRGGIYQCIIDECGMCTEPESMVPIIATKAKQVVLIGDHKQLRPVIKCSDAAELGLEKSIFERYAEMNKHIVMLKIQYRMNPFICDFPSKQFYDGKLETGRSSTWLEKHPLKFWRRNDEMKDPLLRHIPHLFCHIEGIEEVLQVTTEEGNEKSRSNMDEVLHVLKIFKYLTEVEGVKPWTINVISQYNAQCHALKKAFKLNGFENVLVNTVVSSQGGEWDYVIFSLVRSLPTFLIESYPTIGWCKQNLGFITDKNQINVALTRARKGLIIIGNKNLLRCDKVWRDLIKLYEERDCVATTEEFPPSPPKKVSKSSTEVNTNPDDEYTVLYDRTHPVE